MAMRWARHVAGVVVAAGMVAGPVYGAGVNFSREILPLLADRCFQCHGPDGAQRKAGLRLDLEDGAKALAIVPGDPEASPLMARISSDDPNQVMPPPKAGKPPLTDEEIAAVRAWIAEGAPWAQHWAFETPERPAVPVVTDAAWPRNPIDHFVLARLEAQGLRPSPEADRETLIRRVTLDLTGLPPTLDAIDAFVADSSPDAYERVVDRLLASPTYGEHMAVDWLDGARYADTNGYQNDFQRYMWPWRDWVIEAFNANMPFDQFAVEQIAGDLLPNATDSQRIATGFNRNNRANTEGGSIEEEWLVENLVDRVETTSAVFLGLSMGCARCHDHKYDPVSQREFYEFYAFFNSTADRGFYEETRGNTGPQVALPDPDDEVKLAEFDARIAEAQRAVDGVEQGRADAFDAFKQRVAGGPLPQPPHFPVGTYPLGEEARPEVRFGGTPPQWAPGLLGPAYVLDGTANTYVTVQSPARFDRAAPFTVSLWAKPESAGALFSKADDANAGRGVAVYVLDKGEVAVQMASAWPDDAMRLRTDARLRMGTWAHVAVTYDGSGQAGGLRVYVDGKPAVPRIEKNALQGPIDTPEPVRLGRRQAGDFLSGQLAGLRIYHTALNETNVAAAMDADLAAAAGRGLLDVDAPVLAAYHDLRHDLLIQEKRAAVQAIEREKSEFAKAEVPTVMVMEELPEPRPTYLLRRGAYDAPDKSEVLNPAVPEFLPPLPDGVAANRLGLARWLVAPENPLTARVTVNRVWRNLFGRGLVETVDDFGVQGAPPTHPDLLDWLATEFPASGWDLKGLYKTLVMSATYRQASRLSPELLERDPDNVLLARGPRFRLSAEALRDNALAVSGLLSRKIGGPSVMPYQPAGLWEELAGGAGQGPYVQATDEDLYRRSLYTYRKRTVPHPTTASFDAPSWEICRVKRSRTNTPLQALALLNDLTYVEAARKLAERMVAEPDGACGDRLAYGFRLATGRHPEPRERAILEDGFTVHLDTYTADPEAAEALLAEGESPVAVAVAAPELAAYTAVAAVILNLDETVTKH